MVATIQTWEGSRKNPLGGFSWGGDLRNLEGIKVVVPGRQSPECKPSMKVMSFVLFDDVSATPRTCWEPFHSVQEALNKYLMNE